jgi:hypothetical protein
MLPRKNRPFGCTRPKPSQGSVPSDPTPASDFGSCFQCQAGSSLVLRRSIEITPFCGRVIVENALAQNCALEPLTKNFSTPRSLNLNTPVDLRCRISRQNSTEDAAEKDLQQYSEGRRQSMVALKAVQR